MKKQAKKKKQSGLFNLPAWQASALLSMRRESYNEEVKKKPIFVVPPSIAKDKLKPKPPKEVPPKTTPSHEGASHVDEPMVETTRVETTSAVYPKSVVRKIRSLKEGHQVAWTHDDGSEMITIAPHIEERAKPLMKDHRILINVKKQKDEG